jgi:hypothetical protein
MTACRWQARSRASNADLLKVDDGLRAVRIQGDLLTCEPRSFFLPHLSVLLGPPLAVELASTIQGQEPRKPSNARFSRHCSACQTACAAITGERLSLTGSFPVTWLLQPGCLLLRYSKIR